MEAGLKEKWLNERRKGIGANQFNSIPMPERFWAYTKREGSCLLWTGAINKKGYGSMMLNGKVQTSSRIAYKLSFGEIPDGLWVLHHCDNPLCMEPDHLFLGTHQDNMTDRDRKNRGNGISKTSRGEGNIKAKLTERDIIFIRRSKKQTRELADRYQVCRTTIQRIRGNRIWKHLN